VNLTLDPPVFPVFANVYPNPLNRLTSSCHLKSLGFDRKRLIIFSRLLRISSLNGFLLTTNYYIRPKQEMQLYLVAF
jgi:hypothetical protein